MNRIVREHYPVSNLPEDIRKEFPGQDEVTLIVEEIRAQSAASDNISTPQTIKSLEELFAIAAPTFASLDEVAAHVRALRDEWN